MKLWLILLVSIYVLSLLITVVIAAKGVRILEFWSMGSRLIFLEPSLFNGVVIKSIECPMFMGQHGSSISMKIQNNDFEAQPAGVTLLVSKDGEEFDRIIYTDKTVVSPKGEQDFTWAVDQSNLVDGAVSARLFIGISPDHPTNSVRGCVILPWKGPVSAEFVSNWSFPILLAIYTVSVLFFLSISDSRHWKQSVQFFFIFINLILLFMISLLMIQQYILTMLALPFLAIGVIALAQRSPYRPESDYKRHLQGK